MAVFPSSSGNLVFGLEWFATIGAGSRSRARQLARRYRARHLVMGKINASCVGLVAGSRQDGDFTSPSYAAALILAARYPDATVGMVCQLAKNTWWMVASHDGAVVTRSDRVFSDQAQAHRALQELAAFYPGMTQLPCGQSMLDQLATWLDATTKTVCALQPVRRPWQRRGLAVGASVAMVGGASLLVSAGWGYGQDEAPSYQAPSAVDAWKTAQEDVLQQHWLHGSAGTAAVVEALYRLPVSLVGWQLSTAQCVAQLTAWRCHAQYRREHILASNQRFLEAMPAAWKVVFTPLEQARVQWTAHARGQPLAKAPIHSAADNDATLFSDLQAIRPLLPRVTISAPSSLAVPAPLDEAGRPLARPPELARYRLRSVDVQAPLRSASLLLPHVQHIGWERIGLTVGNQVRPSLSQSVLMAQFKGVLYETENE